VTEDELLIGDLVYVKAGMKVAVDGIMVKGNTLKVSE
jgi:cation transport ATPase